MISVTIEPQRYFVEKIAGDLFQVYCVTPAGQSPETYDPTPQQMVQISRSQAYFRIGEIGFEQAWMKNLQSQNPDMAVRQMLIVYLQCIFNLNRNLIFFLPHIHTVGINSHQQAAVWGIIICNIFFIFFRLLLSY